MENIPERVKHKLMQVVNDIIYFAHHRRVPSKHSKYLFVEQILKIDELGEYYLRRKDNTSNINEPQDFSEEEAELLLTEIGTQFSQIDQFEQSKQSPKRAHRKKLPKS